MMSLTSTPTSLGELVLCNSRLQGARRSLKNPITIIGSAKGCDIQLEVDNVRPIHALIALGADGPHLRAWGVGDTLVNGVPQTTGPLHDDDRLTVGPFEFAIHWTAPLADAVDDAPVPEVNEVLAEAMSADRKTQRLESLRKQVSEARAAYRRERQTHDVVISQQLHDLAEARDEIEKREEEADARRDRLFRLRARFIKRWKRHWGIERQRTSGDRALADFEREEMATARAILEADREQHEVRVEVETRRIEHDWDQLKLAQRHARNDAARQSAALDQERTELADERARLKTEAVSLRAERMQMEHHSADLRIEADGMESRVVNLRVVLLQLEEKRMRLGSQPASVPEVNDEPIAADNDAEIMQRRRVLDRLADELADQRLHVLEQANRLAQARNAWRSEEGRLVDEMSQLAEQLRRREEQIAENEKAIGFVEEQVEREQERLRQLCERLDVRQSRLDSIEIDWRGELGRREYDLQQRSRELSRREKALTELCRRWSERRRHEVVALREEHRRCERMTVEASRKLMARDEQVQALDERESQIAARALVIEKARQKLLLSTDSPELAGKRLERLGRHVFRRLAKAESRSDRAREALAAERGDIDRLFGQAHERIEEALIRQQVAADRQMEIERREYHLTQNEATQGETRLGWTTQRAMLERECSDLRAEVDRLAALLLGNDEPVILPLAMAA